MLKRVLVLNFQTRCPGRSGDGLGIPHHAQDGPDRNLEEYILGTMSPIGTIKFITSLTPLQSVMILKPDCEQPEKLILLEQIRLCQNKK